MAKSPLISLKSMEGEVLIHPDAVSYIGPYQQPPMTIPTGETMSELGLVGGKVLVIYGSPRDIEGELYPEEDPGALYPP
jgi:hypothetical protein